MIAYPGQILGQLSTHVAGAGTHVYESNICASTAGLVTTEKANAKGKSKPKQVVSVGLPGSAVAGPKRPLPLPRVGSIVLGRVLRVQRLQLTLSILIVDPELNTENSFDINLYTNVTNDELQSQAILRREDVRMYEKDKIVMHESFRPGDIVRAVVISLGDERNYYVSTAGNENGVLVAKSVDGNTLVPISWKEMRDVVTGKAELRKVAKTV